MRKPRDYGAELKALDTKHMRRAARSEAAPLLAKTDEALALTWCSVSSANKLLLNGHVHFG